MLNVIAICVSFRWLHHGARGGARDATPFGAGRKCTSDSQNFRLLVAQAVSLDVCGLLLRTLLRQPASIGIHIDSPFAAVPNVVVCACVCVHMCARVSMCVCTCVWVRDTRRTLPHIAEHWVRCECACVHMCVGACVSVRVCVCVWVRDTRVGWRHQR